MTRPFLCVAAIAALCSCGARAQQVKDVSRAVAAQEASARDAGISRVRDAMRGLPNTVISSFDADPEGFFLDLASLLEDAGADLSLVDKSHALTESYEPAGLVPLAGAGLSVSRKDLYGTEIAVKAALSMSKAAGADGVTLVFSSAYRSWKYQEGVYARNVREMGKAAADRESAAPGHSQHQLGTAFDFGSITDDFALTKAGKWLASNAARFGFSLSYPEGMESVTGYRHESWHYRYVGLPAIRMQTRWFGGVQQYFLQFLFEYSKGGTAR